ncbi:glycosyltransferase [Aureococcus anophagefferens]|nr:glycosyltransferase [Aureococcus anophagefferens]
MAAPPPGPGVFVTVGTTEFDALVAAATAPPFLARLEALGFAWLRLQVGRGAAPHLPAASTVGGAHVSWFRFTRDLPGEMARAHIVAELAGALAADRHLVAAPGPAGLCDALAAAASGDGGAARRGRAAAFASAVDDDAPAGPLRHPVRRAERVLERTRRAFRGRDRPLGRQRHAATRRCPGAAGEAGFPRAASAAAAAGAACARRPAARRST